MKTEKLFCAIKWDSKRLFERYLWVLATLIVCFVVGMLLGFIFFKNETLYLMLAKSASWFVGLIDVKSFFGQFFSLAVFFCSYTIAFYVLSTFAVLLPICFVVGAIRGFVFAVALITIFQWTFFVALVYTLFLIIFVQLAFLFFCFFAISIGMEQRRYCGCKDNWIFLRKDGLRSVLVVCVVSVAVALLFALILVLFLRPLFTI